jgi:hypothetical protein
MVFSVNPSKGTKDDGSATSLKEFVANAKGISNAAGFVELNSASVLAALSTVFFGLTL